MEHSLMGDVHKCCILLLDQHTTSYHVAKLKYGTLKVCLVVNGEKFQSSTVTITLIGQCPISNTSELFPKFLLHY